jgi:hypothetical protein
LVFGVVANGALFVSSLVTGEIVRFPPGSSKPKTFVAAGINVGTAGVMVDRYRHLLSGLRRRSQPPHCIAAARI